VSVALSIGLGPLVCWSQEQVFSDGFESGDTSAWSSTNWGGTVIVLPGGVEMELVWVPAGTFDRGSPVGERGRVDREDLHQVTLTEGYFLGTYEMTQAQWEAVMGSNPSDPDDPASCTTSPYGVGPDYPVYCVSWNDIFGGPAGSDCLADSFVGRVNSHLGPSRDAVPLGEPLRRDSVVPRHRRRIPPGQVSVKLRALIQPYPTGSR